jgi:actin-related protein 6
VGEGSPFIASPSSVLVLVPGLDTKPTHSRACSMAPRKTPQDGPSPPSRTLIIDNGGHTMKAGFASGTVAEEVLPRPSIIPNGLARDREKKVYVGSQLSQCPDLNEIAFRRPIEKGYLVNWEAQKEVWDHEFFDPKAPLKCTPSETSLILTEAPNALPQLQSNCDQVVFEEFGFARYYRCPGTWSRCGCAWPFSMANAYISPWLTYVHI